MNAKPKEAASEFLAPKGWITAAQKAHPAFKFAVVVGGLAAVVATITRFGASPATLVFGIVVLVVLMVLFLVFAQAARLRRHNLSFASQFLVWAFLCLSIGTALLLFTSAFFNGPLPFRDYIIRSLGLPLPVLALPGADRTPVPAPDRKSAASPREADTCPQGYFYLQSRATDLYLSVDREGTLIQSALRPSDNQIWTTIPNGDYCYLTTKAAVDDNRNECLEIKRAQPDDYSGLGPRKTQNASDQQWAFDQREPGWYVITSKLTEQAIDVPWGDPTRKRLGFFFPHKNNNQQWKWIPL